MADLWMDVDAALSEVPVNLMPLIDDTDFKTREESVVFNQAGLDLVWNFVTTAGAFTQTAVTPTDTAGNYDWVNQGNGMYSIEIPASGGASINNDTEGFGWFTGFATGILPWRGPIIGFRAAALNNADIDGGDVRDVNVTEWLGTAAATPTVAGVPEVDVTHIGGGAQSATDLKDFADDGYDPATNKVQGVVLVDTLTTYTGNTPQTGDSFARLGAPAGASTSADIAAVKAQTAAIEADTQDIQTKVGTPSDFGSGTSTIAANLQDMADNGTAAFDRSTDSLQAIRDRGDAAWTTGAGGADPFLIASGTIGATGNDTTHLHLDGLTQGDDELNDLLIVITDVSASEVHSRWISDWVLSTELATVTTLPFTPEASTDTYAILAVRQDVTGGSGLDAAGVRAAIGLAAANLDTQLADLPTVAEFEARTLVAANYFDPAADSVTVGTNNDKTGYSLTATTGLGNQTANITGNLSGSVGSVTGAVGSVTGNVGGNVAGSVGSVTGAVGSVTGSVGSVTGAVGSVTGNVGGNVVGSVASVAGNVDGSVASVTGAVGSVTGNVGGNVTGTVGGVAGTITTLDALDAAQDSQHSTTQTAVGTVDTVVDAIKVITDALGATAAARLKLSAETMVTGTVNDANTTPTTTVFAASDITEATADHFNGRIVIFTSGALANQASDITDYSLASGEGVFTVTALTEAPADGVTFIIV